MSECWINVYNVDQRELWFNRPAETYLRARAVSRLLETEGVKTLYRLHVKLRDSHDAA